MLGLVGGGKCGDKRFKKKKDGHKPSVLNDLLDCPFCGAPGDLRSDKCNPERPVWNIGCSKVSCIAHRPIFWQHDKHQVIDAWNLRAT